MLTRRRLLVLAVFAAAAIFFAGLVRLLALRFDTGDVFLPYSSLRADPLGTEIFYQSLGALPGRRVSRNKRDLDHLALGKSATLFILGVTSLNLTNKEEKALERFLRGGGRVVLSFFPGFAPKPSRHTKRSPAPSPSPTPKSGTVHTISLKQLLNAWAVSIETMPQPKEKRMAVAEAGLNIDRDLSWHSGIYFAPKGNDWRTIYRVNDKLVIIERDLGAGSIVLAGDSYFLSNEALLVERHPALLAWLAGASSEITFDETHLGVHQELGVVSLLRKYRLGGLVVGFLIFVSLWLWRNASGSLASSQRIAEPPATVTGRDSFSGLVTLLRRGIAPNDLISTCLAEWQKSQPRQRRDNSDLITIAGEGDPIQAYNRLTEIIDTRKWKRTFTS